MAMPGMVANRSSAASTRLIDLIIGMKNVFQGFSREGMAFLRDLKKNNDRQWFAPRKSVYEEQLRLPMIELVRAVHGDMLRFAPEYVGEPAKCVFRIYRDTRFAKD